MGEYVWTRVTIGGAASQSTLDALVEAAQQLFPNGDTYHSVPELIAAALANGASLHIEDSVNYGRTDELEAFCREHGLSFQAAWGAASGNFEAGLTHWSPGMAEPVEESATEAGEPILTLADLRRCLAAGSTLEDITTDLGRADAGAVPALVLAEPAVL